VQQLGGDPFVTWDGLSAKPGAGQTLDYIFVRHRAGLQTLRAVPRPVFASANLKQRLSDHLGIEAIVNLGPGPSVAGMGEPLFENSVFPAVTTAETVYASGD
jgi:hypothetical protein